ncbi:MAG: GTPase domain-containing protein [Candidatus Schekmanbacteria bacterium]|nr:GTPase domain-containing protein [Candidatus Schekmanbacteria bacterium]
MALFDHAHQRVVLKIVYCGPGFGGKTENLAYLHRHAWRHSAPGNLIALATDTGRTLFFDLLPLALGRINGYEIALQLYSVPGQTFYEANRSRVMQGADGIVFVADSQASMFAANVESLYDLNRMLQSWGMGATEFPWVIQYNKRDLAEAMPIADLQEGLNPWGVPCVEATASAGTGVVETLRAITRVVVGGLQTRAALQQAIGAALAV